MSLSQSPFLHHHFDDSIKPVGVHYLLELNRCSPEVLNNEQLIQQELRHAANAAQFTVLRDVSCSFHPQGVTAMLLLSESHMSIHTWPELIYAAVDIFTCSQKAQPIRACEYLKLALQAEQHCLVTIPRGTTFSNVPLQIKGKQTI